MTAHRVANVAAKAAILIAAVGTFREFPPSQIGGSFALDAVLQSLQSPGKND